MANDMILTRADAAHFCRRVGFGGLAQELDHFTGRTVDSVVSEVLNAAVNPLQPPPFMTDPELASWQKREQAVNWWFARMAESRWVNRNPGIPSPLVEKLALFWHGHFATSDVKVNDFDAMFEQLTLFHNGGLGDFEELCQQVAVGPAMLVYLDNATNEKGAPQENFARELMELFTMGVGNYDETDVVEVARAWTGHNTVGWDQVNQVQVNDYLYYPERHDNGIKNIFGIRRDWDGPETITEIVRGSKQQATARFVAEKMFSHFAHARPSSGLVNALAAVFIANDMSVRELLREILSHPRFWGAVSRYQLVKPPIDWIAELVKRTGISTVDQGLLWKMGITGQIPFEPPNVSGWGENGYWFSTATAWGRQDFAQWAVWRAQAEDQPFLNELGDDGVTPDQAATTVLAAFGIVEESPQSRAGLIEWFNTMRAENPYGLEHEGVIMGAQLPEFHVA